LGQHEPALKCAQEAVEIYRELAAARPDAFRPNLALSLSVMADCLENLRQIQNAHLADAEAVAMLSPYFIAEPAAFFARMSPIFQDYVRRCEKAGHEPDIELSSPVLRTFEILKRGDS
jgi:hypothetical protein